jgi:hypothetical protein
MANTAKVSYRRLCEKIAASPQGAKRIDTFNEQKFAVAKANFLKAFDDHKITQDIEAGFKNPSGKGDLAGLLDGVGNLFSFLGLEKSKGNPIEKIRAILKDDKDGLVFSKSRKTVEGTDAAPRIMVRANIRVPRGRLVEATTLVWESGVSWLYQISANGISGFSRYVSGIFKNPPSYSTGGLQSSKKIFAGRTDNVKAPYFNELLKDFKKYFNKLKSR